jgi:drug/metabolite transporter (DMT)-like permease
MNTPTKTAASIPMVVLAFAILYIVWGSTYFFIQKALLGFPALMLGTIRFIIAGLLMMGWCLLKKEKIWNISHIKTAAITGVMLLFIGNGAVIWTEQYMPSVMVAIVISSSPIWFIVLDKPKWKENFNNKATVAGMIIGFAGVLLLFGEKIKNTLSAPGSAIELGGMVLLTLGAMSWAGGSLYSKYKSENVSAMVTSAWQMLAAGIAFLPFSLLRGEAAGFNIQAVPAEAWWSLWYLILFGSIAGFSAYVWLPFLLNKNVADRL